MADLARIPRSRGSVCGVLLILLGAWGGLAPFVGPYFHFAYTPDKAWAYTSGRLWLSIVPGAAAVIGGLLAAGTADRVVGCCGGLLAALGGAWFIVGGAVTALAVRSGSITPGVPLGGPLGSLSAATRVFLEGLGFFTGTGVLIVFLGALALGRFSVGGVRDAALAGGGPAPLPARGYPEPGRRAGQASYPGSPAQARYPGANDATAEFPAAGQDHAPDSQYRPTPPDTPASPAPRGEQARTTPEEYPTMTRDLGAPPTDTPPHGNS